MDENLEVPEEEDAASAVEVDLAVCHLVCQGRQNCVVGGTPVVFTGDFCTAQLRLSVDLDSYLAWRHVPGREVGRPQDELGVWAVELDHADGNLEKDFDVTSSRFSEPVVPVRPIITSFALMIVVVEDIGIEVMRVHDLPGL